MADDKKQPEQDSTPAANSTDYREYRNAVKKYRRTQEQQEILAKSMQQYAQEGQQAQEILDNLGEFDPETKTITVNNEYRAELDPGSPEFDPALYNSYAEAINNQLTATLEQMQAEIDKSAAGAFDVNSEAMQKLLATMENAVAPMVESVKTMFSQFVESDAYKSINDALQYVVDSDFIQERLKEWEQLQPYLEAELLKPEYEGKALEDLTDEQIEQATAAAKAAMLAKQLPIVTITNKGVDKTEYPLDKVNAKVWNLLTEADKTGQLTFAMEKRGSKQKADLIYSIDFDRLQNELTISKKLTAFDKRVYIAASALFNSGYEVITVAQIYAAMGNTGRPSAKDMAKINDSVTKLEAAHIYLNNKSEHDIYKKYDLFVYDASLLPMERVSAIVNGQPVESAIHLFREPPLITFAKERKQITTVSRQLLESPLSKTDANLQIDDYLIEQISHIKNKKRSNKMLYETIFENCHIKERMQRSRAKDKIRKYLDHYKSCNFIKGYKETADGITIQF